MGTNTVNRQIAVTDGGVSCYQAHPAGEARGSVVVLAELFGLSPHVHVVSVGGNPNNDVGDSAFDDLDWAHRRAVDLMAQYGDARVTSVRPNCIVR